MLSIRCVYKQVKTEVPRDVRNSKVWKQDKFRRDWSSLPGKHIFSHHQCEH